MGCAYLVRGFTARVVLFAGFFLENYLLLDRHLLATPVLGVPALIIVVEVVCLAIYARFRSDLMASPNGWNPLDAVGQERV